MSLLFIDLEEVKVYFDDILVLGFDSFQDHLLTLKEVFTRIRKANLQVNMAKSNLQQLKWNTNATLMNVHQVRSFSGSINHYKQIIPHHSHVSTELTALTKKDAKFKWTPNCQAAFDTLNWQNESC